MGNAQASQDRILEAAMAEFSAHGIAGARVDRIAAMAGCNKNLIYIYFKSKENLFTTLLQKHLGRIYEAAAFDPEDLPGYAVQVFDCAMANPDLMRLLTWFSLEQTTAAPSGRRAAMNVKLKALAEAQASGKVGKTFSPGFILTLVMTVATAWTAANPFGPLLDPDAIKHKAALRKRIALAVESLIK
jgi:AcrR family transcriptional regulator